MTKNKTAKKTPAKKPKQASIKKGTKIWSKFSGRPLVMALFVVVFASAGYKLYFNLHAQSYPFAPSGIAAMDLQRINTWRTNHGYSGYTAKSCLNTVAAHWARSEAVNHRIADPSLSYMSSQVKQYCTSNWIGIGVNDGVATYEPSLESNGEYTIWKALLNSCPHIRNIASAHAVKTTGGAQCTSTNNTFRYVGTAAYVGSDNRLYVSQWFARW